MTIEAELFDGTILEFPDGTDPSVIQRTVKTQTAARRSAPTGPVQTPSLEEQIATMPKNDVVPIVPPVPQPGDAPAAPPKTGWGEYLFDTANIASDNVLKGAAAIAGLPVDAVNAAPMLVNLLPGEQGVGPISDYPIGGSKSLYDGATLGGFFHAPDPEDNFQYAVGRTARELGSMFVPTSMVARKAGQIGVEGARAAKEAAAVKQAAQTKIPVVTPALNLPGNIYRDALESAAVDPARFVAKEAAYAGAAGAGAGAANVLAGNTDESNPLPDVGGAIAGAFGLGAGNALLRSGVDIGRAFFGSGSYADEVVRDAVVRDLAANAGVAARPGQEPDVQPIIDAITRGQKVGDTIPGYTESLADRTKIPGIAALEYSRQSGPNAGMYTKTRADNTAAVDRAMGEVAPQATPGEFSSALGLERERLLAEAGKATAGAQTAYDAAVQPLTPLMTGEGRGANIRTALADASDATKRIVEQAWAPVNQSGAAVDVGPLKSGFDDLAEGVPEALKPQLPAAAGVPGTLAERATAQPLSEVMGIRTALTNELRRPGITPQEVRLIEQHVQKLDAYLENTLPPELRTAYVEARAATRDYHDRFTRPQTAIGQTMRVGEGGSYAVPDSAVARKFVQDDQGRIDSFEALMKEAGSDDRVQSAVRDQILQDVKDRGLLTKPLDLQAYLGQYGKVFEKFPGLKAELGTAAALRTQYDTAQAAETSLRDTLTKQGRSTVASYLSYGDEKADQAMKGVLAARKPAEAIDELLTFVGDDPKAVEGARKVFWNVMNEKSRAGGRTTMDVNGAQPWSPQALGDFLNDPTNAAVAERLYRDNPEHLERIREIAIALKGVDLRNSAKAPNSSGTTQGMSQLLTPEALQSRAYAYMSGRISGTFLVTSIASVLIRRGVRKAQGEGYQRMMDEILTNPETAKLLLQENNPANRAALATKAKAWWGNEASTILNALSADDQDETTGKVMGGQ